MPGPLDMLGILARQEVSVSPTQRHLECFTMEGLLTVLAHGPADAGTAVLMCGGAMGGTLGPANGLYHSLGEWLAGQGIASLRVDYRKPNNLSTCVLDVCAVAQMANQAGAERMVVLGHSFGGAVAVNVALSIPAYIAGVATFATQSAGCERVGEIAPKPIRMFHGSADQILPVSASLALVELSSGHAELTVLDGVDHLMTAAEDELTEAMRHWIPEVLAEPLGNDARGSTDTDV